MVYTENVGCSAARKFIHLLSDSRQHRRDVIEGQRILAPSHYLCTQPTVESRCRAVNGLRHYLLCDARPRSVCLPLPVPPPFHSRQRIEQELQIDVEVEHRWKQCRQAPHLCSGVEVVFGCSCDVVIKCEEGTLEKKKESLVETRVSTISARTITAFIGVAAEQRLALPTITGLPSSTSSIHLLVNRKQNVVHRLACGGDERLCAAAGEADRHAVPAQASEKADVMSFGCNLQCASHTL
mmetsp:Transcript_15616/g.39618  ORF Transcript_15616/g.39618 Transcript_15616/m.39618 type:complete len:239 (+) Transcript_15616:1919-2635(+)